MSYQFSFSSAKDPVLSELEAIPQPKYSGSYYTNFKKMAIKSYQADSDDDLSVIDDEDSDDEGKNVKHFRRTFTFNYTSPPKDDI
jgi:hypothetical protein